MEENKRLLVQAAEVRTLECFQEVVGLQSEDEPAKLRDAYERLQVEASSHVEENKWLLAQAAEVRY